MRVAAFLVLCLLCAASASCAANAASPASVQSWAVHDLVDSIALLQSFQVIAAGPGGDALPTELNVVYNVVPKDSTPSFVETRQDLPRPLIDSILATFQRLKRRPDAVNAGETYTLQISRAGAGEISAHRSQIRRPELLNRDQILQIIDALGQFAPTGGVVDVWVRLGSDGGVRDTRVGTRSGTPELNAMVLDAAKSLRFTPALADGVPIPIWLSIPFDIRIR